MASNISKILAFIGEHALPNSKLTLDSRDVTPGDVFFALKGLSSDGRKFIRTALAQGASCVVSEGEEFFQPEEKVLEVPALRSKLADIASAYYGYPSEQMIGIAVTGTNGKTTTTHWISALLNLNGVNCAVLGTIGCFYKNSKIPAASLTTPDILTLERILSCLKAEGCQAFAMEASSIGLEQGRMSGLKLKIGAFTNLTRDHLDYHKTFENYAKAKGILFSWPDLQTAVINLDDPRSKQYISIARENKTSVITFSRQNRADLYATDIKHTKERLSLNLHWKDKTRNVSCGFIGLFNVENFLTAAGCALAAGLSFEQVCANAGRLTPPAGRMEIVAKGANPLVVVDYSHTPDALEKAIETLRDVKEERLGKLWVIVGAGGDRDPGKRQMMGEVASKADYAVISSDNPRSEDPLTILEQVAIGALNPVKIVDRRDAIRYAISNAAPQDVILIAGKGHEDYQEINGVKHHFSDVEESRNVLTELRRI